MKARSTILSSAVATMVLLASAGPATAHDFGRWWKNTPAQLVGTWEVKIVPYNCATLVESTTTVTAYHSFASGGTMTEVTAGISFLPGQRAPGVGFWERTGWRSYRSVFEGFLLFDTPSTSPPPLYKRGKQRFDQGIEITDDNHWSSDAIVTFTDINGTTVPPSGCAHVTAERMQ